MDLSKLDIHPDDYALYCQEPKDPGGAEDGAIEEEEEDEVEETPYGLNMHCIQPNLWIGDWTASQQVDVLRELGIKHIIAALRGRYQAHEGFQVHQVDVDDTAQTNMLAHFGECNHIIKQALEKNEGVLIHCQAGISRSATICAAYLMESQKMTADEAIQTIAAVRSQVDPIEFFVLQLEMYERMNYVVDPATSQEYRRFLYNFNRSEIMDGDGTVDKLYLAYFPSPAITPRSRSRRSSSVSSLGSTLGMSSISRRSSFNSAKGGSKTNLSMSAQSTENNKPSEHRKPRRPTADFSMTAMGADQHRKEVQDMLKQHESTSGSPQTSSSTSQQTSAGQQTEDTRPRQEESPEEARRREAREMLEGKEKLYKMGQGRVQITGKRLRCKMCRRELADREHIVEHTPGEGQQSFAPRRRDMAQYRADQNKTTTSAARVSGSSGANAKTQNPRDNPNHPLNMLARRTAQLNQSSEGRPAAPAPPRPASPPLLSSPLCTSYFVEPLSWMGSALEDGAIGGKLVCPGQKCGSKLGSFDWAGQQCSCGAWVVPAFSLNASKVDEL